MSFVYVGEDAGVCDELADVPVPYTCVQNKLCENGGVCRNEGYVSQDRLNRIVSLFLKPAKAKNL